MYLTDETHVCPRCEAGTCDDGPNQEKPCAVDGEVDVAEAATSNKHFRLSKDCPPPTDLLTGTLVINPPLTTGSSTLAPLPGGSTATPCVAQGDEPRGLKPKADNCLGGTCTAACTGQACVDANGKDYTTGATVCVDAKGGLSQRCCSTRTDAPCPPTDPDSGGEITRVGKAQVPQPPWPDATYPKTTSCACPGECTVQVATFCEPATGTSSIDSLTGLPGPGALILPVATEWLTPSP